MEGSPAEMETISIQQPFYKQPRVPVTVTHSQSVLFKTDKGKLFILFFALEGSCLTIQLKAGQSNRRKFPSRKKNIVFMAQWQLQFSFSNISMLIPGECTFNCF